MRILFVTASYPPDSVGGVELHVAGLARAMAAHGHHCTVFARTGREGLPHLQTFTESVDGIEVTRLANTFEDADSFERMYRHEGIDAAFARQLERVRPDVVHIHHLTCLSTSIVDRCREAGVPVMMTLHDFWMGCPRGQRITAGLDVCPTIRLGKCLPCLRELWPHLLGRGRSPELSADERDARDLALLEQYHASILATLSSLDRVVTPSRFLRAMYVEYGVPAERIQVVENGLPVGHWEGHRAPPSPTDGPLRIGFIGSVMPSKGVHLLVEAFRQLGDPSGMRLDIWGEVLPFHNDRSYGERLEALRRGFESAITLHGAYGNDELPKILSRLDVVVVPSLWYEAFGLTIREAHLAHVPVVVAGHGAMAEAVEHGRTGLTFEAGDASALADALRRLADDPALRERLGEGAPVRDEVDAARELLGLYDRLAGGQPGAGDQA
ncbi:MAG: glycosyltransferase family 4 protein [Planctomycetota bacterium]|jgi:glycosyltransferase involved in cell wall biosynthesis